MRIYAEDAVFQPLVWISMSIASLSIERDTLATVGWELRAIFFSLQSVFKFQRHKVISTDKSISKYLLSKQKPRNLTFSCLPAFYTLLWNRRRTQTVSIFWDFWKFRKIHITPFFLASNKTFVLPTNEISQLSCKYGFRIDSTRYIWGLCTVRCLPVLAF